MRKSTPKIGKELQKLNQTHEKTILLETKFMCKVTKIRWVVKNRKVFVFES